MNEGAHILPVTNYSSIAVSGHKAEKRQAETLSDEGYDLYWAGPIAIGSNKKSFTIDFDSTRLPHLRLS